MTPAVVAARQAGVACRVIEYAHDPAVRSFGLEAATALGVEPARVFKTLVAALPAGDLLVAVIPVDARLDLKALAGAVGAKKAALAEPASRSRPARLLTVGCSKMSRRGISKGKTSLRRVPICIARRECPPR